MYIVKIVHSYIDIYTKSNYPYVDLISDDDTILVQVSTNQNITEKIKSTLEKIRDSSVVHADKIKEVYFFVLDNSSISNVKDYSNNNQIGNISFLKDKHLITTKNVIEKAKVDLDFQKNLYELCVYERNTISVCVTSLKQAINNSKSLIEDSIDDLIAGEYEINRSEILSEMNESTDRFISVQGVAGSGKSALCKKFLKDKDLVLFARAEKFIEANSLDSIWNLNLQDVFRYTANKRIYIYILMHLNLLLMHQKQNMIFYFSFMIMQLIMNMFISSHRVDLLIKMHS